MTIIPHTLPKRCLPNLIGTRITTTAMWVMSNTGTMPHGSPPIPQDMLDELATLMNIIVIGLTQGGGLPLRMVIIIFGYMNIRIPMIEYLVLTMV